MSKLLSIVVPTYNMEAYLDKCLTSLISDDPAIRQALEVLVINDGSKDKSLDVAREYEKRYPDTFKAVDKPNGNYGSCVNKGLELATGKYFRILDADDWFDTSALESLVLKLKDTDADLVFTRYATVYPEITVSSSYPQCVECDRIYDLGGLAEEQLPYYVVRMHGMTYRTEVLRQVGLRLQCGISYTDTEFCYYPSRAAKTSMFYDLQLYCYNNAREGQTMDPKVRARSVSHLHKVLKPLLSDYFGNLEQSGLALRTSAAQSILIMFYMTALCDCKKNADLVSMLREIDGLLLQQPSLYAFTDSLKRYRIHYVKVWRMTGLLNTSLPFRVYNGLWEGAKKLLKR